MKNLRSQSQVNLLPNFNSNGLELNTDILHKLVPNKFRLESIMTQRKSTKIMGSG
jgi:hypothetical protein